MRLGREQQNEIGLKDFVMISALFFVSKYKSLLKSDIFTVCQFYNKILNE